jgi:hypothetical protein
LQQRVKREQTKQDKAEGYVRGGDPWLMAKTDRGPRTNPAWFCGASEAQHFSRDASGCVSLTSTRLPSTRRAIREKEEQEPNPQAGAKKEDRAFIPYCKQHMTGKEAANVDKVMRGGLDSASTFTDYCADWIKHYLGATERCVCACMCVCACVCLSVCMCAQPWPGAATEACPLCLHTKQLAHSLLLSDARACRVWPDRVVIVPSGTAALEMAALLSNLDKVRWRQGDPHAQSSMCGCILRGWSVSCFLRELGELVE